MAMSSSFFFLPCQNRLFSKRLVQPPRGGQNRSIEQTLSTAGFSSPSTWRCTTQASDNSTATPIGSPTNV